MGPVDVATVGVGGSSGGRGVGRLAGGALFVQFKYKVNTLQVPGPVSNLPLPQSSLYSASFRSMVSGKYIMWSAQ